MSPAAKSPDRSCAAEPLGCSKRPDSSGPGRLPSTGGSCSGEFRPVVARPPRSRVRSRGAASRWAGSPWRRTQREVTHRASEGSAGFRSISGGRRIPRHADLRDRKAAFFAELQGTEPDGPEAGFRDWSYIRTLSENSNSPAPEGANPPSRLLFVLTAARIAHRSTPRSRDTVPTH